MPTVVLEDMFSFFSRMGDKNSDGQTITLVQADKWLKQAKVIDGKKVTTADSAEYFNKFKAKALDIRQFEEFIALLSNEKNLDVNDMKRKLTSFAFSKFGDAKADGKTITLTQADKWMKQAEVIDGKKITTTDTAINFKKMQSKTLSFKDFEKYLKLIADDKKTDVKEMKEKMINCGMPGTSGQPRKQTVGMEKIWQMKRDGIEFNKEDYM